MDILTFLGLDYRVALLKILYFVVPGIDIPKIRSIEWLDHIKIYVKKVKKSTCLKWAYRHSCNDYRVATFSKLYLTTKGITMQSLKSWNHRTIHELTKKLSVCDGRTYWHTDQP